MTDEKDNKVSSGGSNVRLPDELRRELRRVAFERGQTTGKEPSYGDLLLEAWNKANAQPVSATAPTNVMPGIFEGLTDDEVWLVHQLAGILRDRPQGDIFAILDSTLEKAAKSYAATHRNPRKRPAKSPHQVDTPSARHMLKIIKGRSKSEWLEIASRVLDSPDADLVDAITSNLKQFGKDAEALRHTGHDLSHADPGSGNFEDRVEGLLAGEAHLESQAPPEKAPARPPRAGRSGVASVEKRPLPPTGSGGKH